MSLPAKQCQFYVIFDYFDKCERCFSACRGAFSPIRSKKTNKQKNLTRRNRPILHSRLQNNHQSIQSSRAESPARAAERSTKRTHRHNSCSVYWETSSTKHDPLHSVHIQEATRCQEKQRLPAQTGFVRIAGRGRYPGGSGQMYSFPLDGMGGWGGVGWRWRGLLVMTAGDGCPKSHQRSDVRQRWSKTCGGWNRLRKWGRWGGGSFFYTSRCDPHLLPLPK